MILPTGGQTRSHCHAWSSAPVYFMSRITLGIKQTQAGGRAFEISPWINDLEWVRGTVASTLGQIHVSWKRQGKTVCVDFWGPKQAQVKFVSNSSHKGLKLIVNGRKLV